MTSHLLFSTASLCSAVVTGKIIIVSESVFQFAFVINIPANGWVFQEHEYLQNCVAKICKYRPDILLVEGTVTRVAQQLLLDTGITVIINVKTVSLHTSLNVTGSIDW